MDGGYSTKQQRVLLDFLQEHKDCQYTADELATCLKEFNIGRATVYRQLEKLVVSGEVKRYNVVDDKSFYYRYVGNARCEEHFHLVCIKCKKIIHMECEMLYEVSRHISSEHHFAVDASKTVFYGYCDSCGGNNI